MTVGTRIGIGVVGAILLLVGWVTRSLEQETSSLGIVMLQDLDGTYGAYSPDVSYDGPFEIEETAEPAVFQVVHQGREIMFSGSQDEAAFWIETRGAEPAFTATRAEVEAYVDEQNAAEDYFFWAYVLMTSGGIALLAAVALGPD